MVKTKIATRILSCLLVLTLLLTSVVTSVSFTKESDKNPVYKLKQVNYSQEIPLKWRFTNSSGYTYTKTLTTHYFRGASPDTPNVYDIIAYCMDWGVRGPDPNGSTYDHKTDDVSQEKINQLTYVIMNGYPHTKSYTLRNKYNVDRHGRSTTITDDQGQGTMMMQLATQTAIWLVMGKDSRGRVMTTDGWVRNYNCQNLDCDIMEMAMDLYEGSKSAKNGINWLSTDIASSSAGRYDAKTSSKIYGPFCATSSFTKSDSDITFALNNAPKNTKILDGDFKETKTVGLYEDFYVSVPNSASPVDFSLTLYRDTGMVLPLSYEEVNESRQRMFFSTLSSVSTKIDIKHTQSDAQLKIVKTSDDNKVKDICFAVGYRANENAEQISLGYFYTDNNGEILITGLSSGLYDVYELLDSDQERRYVPCLVDKNGNVTAEASLTTVVIAPDQMELAHTVRFHNKVNTKTKLVINKFDQFTGEPISGAEFQIVKAHYDAASGQYVPNKNPDGTIEFMVKGKTYDDSYGLVVFGRDEANDQYGTEFLTLDAVYTNGELLPENNTYIFGEVTAADGYVKPVDGSGKTVLYPWTLDKDNENCIVYLDVNANGDDFMTGYPNRPFLNTLKVTKTEEGTSKPIAGVQFNIYDTTYGGYNYVDTITTDENGIAKYGYGEDGKLDTTYGEALKYGNTYVIKEISAPEGYEANTSYINVPTVTEDGKELSINVTNKKSSGSLTLNKVDDKKSPIAGTKFSLYKVKDEYLVAFDDYMNSRVDIKKQENAQCKYLIYFMDNNGRVNLDEVSSYLELVENYTTDNKGQIKKELQYGDYLLIETEATKGYDKLNAVYRFGVYESGFNYLIECINDPIAGSVELVKTNSATGEFIKDVKFKLLLDKSDLSEPDIEIGTYTTDENGKIRVDGLALGDYYFLEIETPDRYVAPEDADTKEATKFTIDEHKEVENISYTNDEKASNILVYKTDKTTGTPIQGVKFALMKGDTKYAEAVTNSEGLAAFINVELGEYKLVEITAAEGYDINSFEPKDISVTEYKVQKIYVGNDKIKASIKLLKVDKDTNNPLENVEFTLYKTSDENNALRTLKTDKDGIVKFEDVEYGEYVVVETKTVKGYKLSETKTFVNVNESKEFFYTITNEIIKRNIKLIKVDKDTVIPIANVEFDVFALVDGEYVKYTTVTTDENGECNFTLPFGEYELRETKSGKGYKINSETTKIDLTLEDIEDILEITITNELIKNKITLVKHGDEIGNLLKGATYGLYNMDTDELIAKGTTDEKGEFCFGDIPYGSYYLKEIEAPEGYTLSNDVLKFTVDENSDLEQTINAIDTAVPQTGFNSNTMLLFVLSILSCGLFLSIVILEYKARRLVRSR